MARIRKDFFTGTLSSQLNSGATTMMSAALSSFDVVATPDTAAFVIDPDGTTPEVVYVSAHTSASTSATISRGEDGTTDRTWAAGTTFACAPIASDFRLPNLANPDGGYDIVKWDDTADATVMKFRDRAGGTGVYSLWEWSDYLDAPIMWLANEGGLSVNDNIKFMKNVFDHGIGFQWLDQTNNKQPAILFGAYANIVTTVDDEEGTTITLSPYCGLYIRGTQQGHLAIPTSLLLDQHNAQDIGSTSNALRIVYAQTAYYLAGKYILFATASPESSKTANPGSLCMSEDGHLWVKNSGTGNTGWIKVSEAIGGDSIPLHSAAGAALTTSLTAVSSGWFVLDPAQYTVPTNRTMQYRVHMSVTGATASDVIGGQLWDQGGAAALFTEWTATAPASGVVQCVSGWQTFPASLKYGYIKVRNQTGARGTCWSSHIETRFA